MFWGKRADGYHELEMVMSSVDLADRLIMEELEEDKIIIETYKAFLPIDKRNNVYQAASIVKNAMVSIKRYLRIRITKKYPCSSRPWRWQYRLCSSAKGMDRLWQLGLTMPELIDIGGMEVGTDVPLLHLWNDCVHLW